ncbi:hypothetical protein ACHAXA_000961, partial [Cyclostephanos tholiformis]
ERVIYPPTRISLLTVNFFLTYEPRPNVSGRMPRAHSSPSFAKPAMRLSPKGGEESVDYHARTWTSTCIRGCFPVCGNSCDISPPGWSHPKLARPISPDNFFLYSNGNWMRDNPIPSGYSSWNSFMSLRLKSQEDCRRILAESDGIGGTGDVSDEERKVALFYGAAMDEDAIEAAGTRPMLPLLELCEEAAKCRDDKVAYASCLGRMSMRYGVTPFFSIGSGPDKKDSDRSIAQVSQGGIRLPDRDYYFDQDKEGQRSAYKNTIALMLTLLVDPCAIEPSEESIDAAERVFELEKSLAEGHMTKTENRDPHDTYNKMTMEGLIQIGDGAFDFGSYFSSATGKNVEEIGDINLRNTKAIARMTEVASSVDEGTMHAYFRWMAVSSCAPYLSKPFVNAHFDFYEKTLQGTQEIKERWKRAMEFTESALGEALGKLYCAKYFDETSKGRALAIVEQVRLALENRLKEVDWMKSEETRANALKKMDRFGVKIGYPDKWLDYSTLLIDGSDDFLTMVFRSREFANIEEAKEINAPTDKSKWFMTPQTVNAYYHPNLNEIVFPAAILQHPFFDKDADDAVNFGSMGAVIGHEMTVTWWTGGRKRTEKSMRNASKSWLSRQTSLKYTGKRSRSVTLWINQCTINAQTLTSLHPPFSPPPLHLPYDNQGKLTSGENIADLGGLRLALRGLISTKGYDPDSLIDGFSPMQRFFLSWAQCWRQNVTKERALQLLTIDPHGPNEMRCNGPLSNMPEFHEAFSVTPNDPMYKESAMRVDIW